jgi:hypothetical protein
MADVYAGETPFGTAVCTAKNLAAGPHIRQDPAGIQKLLEKQMRKVMMGAAAAAMLVGSSMAQAAPVELGRTGAPVASGEQLGGGGGYAVWLGLLAAALLVFIAIQINDSDDEVLPRSP